MRFTSTSLSSTRGRVPSSRIVAFTAAALLLSHLSLGTTTFFSPSGTVGNSANGVFVSASARSDDDAPRPSIMSLINPWSHGKKSTNSGSSKQKKSPSSKGGMRGLFDAKTGEVELPSGVRKIVSVGDFHGDYESAQATLELLGVISIDGTQKYNFKTGNAFPRWRYAGTGNTLTILTGDYTDRGPHGFEIIEMLSKVREEAQAAGTDILLLLGNHEVWRFTNEQNAFLNYYEVERYITLDLLTSIKSKLKRGKDQPDPSEHDLQGLLKKIQDFAAQGWPETLGGRPEGDGMSYRQWSAINDPDKSRIAAIISQAYALQRQEHLMTQGAFYRDLIATMPAAVMVHGILFSHGGASPQLIDHLSKEPNRKSFTEHHRINVAKALQMAKDEQWPMLSNGEYPKNQVITADPIAEVDFGILTNSRVGVIDDHCPTINPAHAKTNIKFQVIGHKIGVDGEPRNMCDGAVFGNDLAISRYIHFRSDPFHGRGGIVIDIGDRKKPKVYSKTAARGVKLMWPASDLMSQQELAQSTRFIQEGGNAAQDLGTASGSQQQVAESSNAQISKKSTGRRGAD